MPASALTWPAPSPAASPAASPGAGPGAGLRTLLPQGLELPEPIWRARHRVLTVVLFAHLPALAVIGLVQGQPAVHLAGELAAVAALGVLGQLAPGRGWRSGLVSVGLLSCVYVLIHLTGGLIEAHFHLFVLLGLVAFYQSWIPYLLALGSVVVHHASVGLLAASSVYSHPAAASQPLKWMLVHASFVLAAVAVQVTYWRFTEHAQLQAQAGAQRTAEDAHRQLDERLELERRLTGQADVLSATSGEVSASVQSVSAAVEELNASIRDIAQNAGDASRVAAGAVAVAEATNATVSRLGDSSAEIGKVIEAITGIAEQTNLLALNATIEAARAGEAGRGFAVVAGEVKELAKETAKATEEIGTRIAAIQTDTSGAVEAIGEIGQIIGRINDSQRTIASAVEEQTATTGEIARSVDEAARGSAEIAGGIGDLAALVQGADREPVGSLR